MTSSKAFAALLLPLLAVLACGRSEQGQPAMQESASGTRPAAATPARKVALETMNASDITGDITLSHSSDTLLVELKLDHLTPGDQYAAELYGGTCAAQGGKIMDLQSVLAAESGKGASTSRIAMDDLGKVPAQERQAGLFVQVMQPDGTQAACGNLTLETTPTTM